MSDLLEKIEATIASYFVEEKHSSSHVGHVCDDLHPESHAANRFQSFVPPSTGDAKWYVDGCSYFWAVSEALEQARESIYILDWWLSPELYLRRPPAANEQYRLDAMLKAAAERGVKIYVIVYKEVEAVLTLQSVHTKHALEALHPNIKVFRHPDHAPASYDVAPEIKDLENITDFSLSTVSKDALKALYGVVEGVVLYWAHHEKLIVIDESLVFMGGLDLCFGRWDTNSHPIADAHPGNLDNILFPGQDYNNARIYDFANVSDWDQNKLDRTKSSRMGWSDVALSLYGPIVADLVHHFVDRWNYIFDAKYGAKDPGKYERLDDVRGGTGPQGQSHDMYNRLTRGISDQMENLGITSHRHHHQNHADRDRLINDGALRIQLTRSCTRWSSGHSTEHSIANAYVSAISTARHFIYIENQFFITATSDDQRPVVNKIGAAIVDRIIRARDQGEMFRVWVVMPCVPAFAGDLRSKDALGTRAIMKFQYNSISRGKDSIYERLKSAGIKDPSQYIGFYNLRNFDRINTSQTMRNVEQRAGMAYEDGRRAHDGFVNASYYADNDRSWNDPGGHHRGDRYDDRDRYEDQRRYQSYQSEASQVQDTTSDTVSASYMDDGYPITHVPWDGNPEDEVDAYVSEELYIHTKLLIADDRLAICGSANLNDRSQLGTHDSEIAVVMEGGPSVDSYMYGHRYEASEFVASLRRQIFRKHLGLLPNQHWDRPDQNWCGVDRAPNSYDWGSKADQIVEDPLSPRLLNLWEDTARVNTEVFSRAFHAVPDNKVRTWNDYDSFFSQYFNIPGAEEENGDKKNNNGKVEYGHVVRDEFPGGVQELKEWLGHVRGTLVHMALDFLVDEKDIAEEGLTLNGFTNEIYT